MASGTLLAEIQRLNDWYNEEPREGAWYWYVYVKPDGTCGADGMHDDVQGCVEARVLMTRISAITTPVEHYLLKQWWCGYQISELPDGPVSVNEEAIKTLNEMDRENRRRRYG